MSITSIFGAKFSWTTLYSFGLWIGRNPYKTILGSLLFCAVCSSGMLTWYTLTDDEYLWTPYGSEVRERIHQICSIANSTIFLHMSHLQLKVINKLHFA